MPSASQANLVQCRRCLRVFVTNERAVTSITETPPRPSMGRTPSEVPERGSLATRVARLLDGAGPAFFILFILVIAVDAALLAIFGYEFMQREGFVPRDPNFQLGNSVNQVALNAPTATYLTLMIWCIAAGHNARRLNVSGLMAPKTLFLWLVFCPGAPVVGYVHLQHLWKSSDPLAFADPESWRKAQASWTIRAFGLLCIAATLPIAFNRLFEDGPLNPTLGLLILASMMAACILLIVIVYRIGQRQQQRYIHLYEDPP
jgi:hypothetical protein